MDSGNSGSIQSSSGGSEEYDSRADAISAFLSGANSSHQQQGVFDSVSSYFDSLPRSPNPTSLLNLDMVWPRGLRSDPNCTDLSGFISSPLQQQQVVASCQSDQGDRANFVPSQLLQPPDGSTTSRAGPSGPAVSDQTGSANNSNAVRPKKRSRASRRAPTTVLTTDTSNFRAMVQEFTGIPSPPFAASPFQRSRLDLFGSASSAIRSAHLDSSSAPPYLLRPFAQKFQPPPFLYSPAPPSSSSLIADAVASTGNNTVVTSNSANFQFSHQNVLNIQNPILNLQSFLQASQKQPVQNDFGLGHIGFGLTDITAADGGAVRRNEGTNTQNWGDNGSQQSLTNGKLNSLSVVGSSDFRADNKGPGNVASAAAASRTEGMVEQWICQSDLKNA